MEWSNFKIEKDEMARIICYGPIYDLMWDNDKFELTKLNDIYNKCKKDVIR